MEKKLVIIDGSSLLYRAFYALPATMTSPGGIPTNAVFGFLRMLLGIYKELDPEYLAVAFDKSKDTFRSEMYSDYKATRKAAPDELVPQFALIRQVLAALGVPVYELAGYEGDDILGTISLQYEKELPVIIVTGDRDALQLASQNTTIYLTKRGITQMARMTPEAVEETYHITPQQVIDIKALMGDASDNIPGVKGIGEKTALKLLQSYHSLDNLYAHVDELKGAQKKKIAEGKESAYLSYKLATINRHVPMKFSLEKMKQPVHYDELRDYFQKLGINLLNDFKALPRFQQLSAVKENEVKKQALPWSEWNEAVSFSGKTVSLVPALQGKAPFYHADSAVIYDGKHCFLVKADQFQDLSEKLKAARQVIVLDSKAVMESNLDGGHVPFFDLTIAAYLLDPTRITYPLSYLTSAFGGTEVYPDDAPDEAKKDAMIAACIYSLFSNCHSQLEKQGVLSLYQKVEQPLVPVLAAMEKAGIATDQKKWHQALIEVKEKIDTVKREIYEEAGEEFNINSPKQLGHILFEKMNLPAGKKTKTGYSTAAKVLDELAVSYPFVKKILEYRTEAKLFSTYLEALPKLICPETGRIHTHFNQTVTATGRLSSSDPNLQNIPVRTEEGKRIRSLFVPGPGYDEFISSDYSQVELRVLAHMSGDPGLIRAFKEHEDIHRRTAAQVLGIPFEEVTPEQRSHAKAVNFGIIYGISDYGLSQQLGITRQEAADYIKKYFEQYPSIHKFMNSLVEKARETGRAVTMFGRFRDLPDINSKNFNRRSFAERTAMNTPIQGTAADIMKMSMIEVYKRLKEGQYKSRILLQVHDELIVETIESEKEAVEALLKDAMENVVHLSVPLIVDVHAGKDWAETK